jgi:hypothetical protein
MCNSATRDLSIQYASAHLLLLLLLLLWPDLSLQVASIPFEAPSLLSLTCIGSPTPPLLLFHLVSGCNFHLFKSQ